MNYYKRHIGDYMKDASHLSLLEHGVYMRLLDVYYTRETPIPAEQAARLIGARSKDEKEALSVVLGEFFTLDDGFYTQTRCDSEIAQMQAKAETNREVGKRGGRPKKDTRTVDSGNPEKTQTVSENNPDVTLATSHKPVTNNQEEKGEPRKRDPRPAFARPDDVDEQTWADWLALRKAKRAPVTQTTVDGAREQAGMAGMPLVDFLRVWCRRGSQGLEADWLKPDERIPPRKGATPSRHNGFQNLNYREGIAEDGTFA